MVSHTDPSSIIALAVVLPVLDIIFVILRFWTRRMQKKSLALDDWLTIPATVLTIGHGICLVIGVHYRAYGYPTPSAPNAASSLSFQSEAATLAGKLQYAFQLNQTISLALVKISVLLFYRRIFRSRSTTTAFNVTITVWIIVIAMWAVAFFFALLFACRLHFFAIWTNAQNLLLNCVNTIKLGEGWVISDFITDIVTLVIPLPMIWRLQMNLDQKLAITGVFLLGAVAVGGSLVRMAIYEKAVYQIFHNLARIDPDLLVTKTLYWSMFESGLALIACCLPTLRPLFSKIPLGKLQQSIRSVLSLSSHSTERQSHDKSNRRRYERQDNESSISQAPIVKDKGEQEEAATGLYSYAMHDLEAPLVVPPAGQIRLTNTIARYGN